MAIPEVRTLTEAEKAKGFKSIIYVRPAPPTLGKGVLEEVDPETGQRTGRTFDRSDRSQYGLGGRRDTDYQFVGVAPRTEVAASIRRREEKGERETLAEQEARFEAQRIETGKIKAKNVVLTQPGSKERLLDIFSRQRSSQLESISGEQLGPLVGPVGGTTFSPRREVRDVIGDITVPSQVKTSHITTPLSGPGVITGTFSETASRRVAQLGEEDLTGMSGPQTFSFQERTVIKPGSAFEVGFIPVSEQLVAKKLDFEGVKVPETLTTSQKFSIFKRDVTFDKIMQGVVEIPTTLGKDLVTIGKGPSPTTPQFALALGKDEKLRTASVRVGTTTAIIGGLALLPPIASIGVGIGATGFETARFIQRPTGVSLGRLLFVGGVSAYAAKSILPKKGGLTIVKAPVSKPIAATFRQRSFLFTKDIPSILRGRPQTTGVPSVRLIDLGSVVKGRGTEIIGAKFTLGAGASSSILISKPETITGIKTPGFITKLRQTPSNINKLLNKKVRISLELEKGTPSKATSGIQLRKVVGRQFVNEDLILGGKRTTRQREITELQPTTVGNLLKETFALPQKPLGKVEIIKQPKAEVITKSDLFKGPVFITKSGSFKGLLKEQFGLGKSTVDVKVQPKTITLKDLFPKEPLFKKTGSFKGLFDSTVKPFKFEIIKPPTGAEKSLRILRLSTIGLGLRQPGPVTYGDLQEGLQIKSISERAFPKSSKPFKIEIIKPPKQPTFLGTKRFAEDLLKGGKISITLVKGLKSIEGEELFGQVNFKGDISIEKELPKGITTKDVLQHELIHYQFGRNTLKARRDFLGPFEEGIVRKQFRRNILFEKEGSKIKVAEPPIKLEVIKKLTKDGSVTIKIPKFTLDFPSRQIGEGIGVSDVKVRQIDLGIGRIRFIKFGPQRVIGFTPRKKPKELELFYGRRPIISPEGRLIGIKATAFPSRRELIFSATNFRGFIGISRPIVQQAPSIIRLPEEKKKGILGRERKIESGSLITIQKTEQQIKQVQKQQQKSISKSIPKPKQRTKLQQDSISVIIPGVRGKGDLSSGRFDKLSATVLGSKSIQSQKQIQRSVQDLVKDTKTDQIIIPGFASARASLRRIIPKQDRITKQIIDFDYVPPPPDVPGLIILLPTVPRGTVTTKRRGKKLKRPTKYRPSIVAIEGVITGRRPTTLTGLGVRPIPINTRRMIRGRL